MILLSEIIPELASFGAAGLMGVMWLTERKLNYKQERQLSDSHRRIMKDNETISCLTSIIQENTAALTRLNETQKHQTELIKYLLKDSNHAQNI